MMKTFKELREYCNGVESVTSRAAFDEAVPVLVEGIEKLKSMSDTMKSIAKLLGKLNEKCSKYAMEHPTMFDEGLATSQIGVISGDVTIGDEAYHFVSGYGTPVRKDGERLTQDFLLGLPEGWYKVMAKLDTNGIKRITGLGDYADQLDKYGLAQPVVYTWSLKSDVKDAVVDM